MAELNQTVAGSCANLFGTSPPQLAPNSDIAGIGVILSFLLSAYLPLIFIIVSYVTGVVPIQLLSRGDTDFFRAKYRRRSQWHKTLVKAILLFSDQQIVTGIAIMVAVYSRLDTTSVYHFRIAMFLAWMSSNTHLTTLVVLRRYLMESTVLRIWRCTGLLVLYVMLLVALIPGCYWNWELLALGQVNAVFDGAKDTTIYFNPNLPARCIFKAPDQTGFDFAVASRIYSETAKAAWIFNIMLVTFLYVIKTSLLFRKLSYLVYFVFKAYPLFILEKGLKSAAASVARYATIRRNTGNQPMSRPAHLGRWARFRYRALMSLYVIVYAFLDFFQTFITNVFLLAWGTVWGTIEIVNASATFSNSSDSQESFWGFGQILPMMLLLLPIASVIDSLFGSRDKDIGQGTHHELIMEEGGTVSTSSSTSSRTSRSSSTSTSRSNSRVNQPLPPIPQLTEADFAAPPRYQSTVSLPQRTFGLHDQKVPVTEEYDWTLESPAESPTMESSVGTFPMPPRSSSAHSHRSTSPFLPRNTSPSPVRGHSRTVSEKRLLAASTSSAAASMPAPHQFLGGRPRLADADQPLTEHFRTLTIRRPRLRDPTFAAFAENTRTLALHRYLYRTKWCKVVFLIDTLAMLASILTLTLYGVLQSQNPLATWNSTATIAEAWLGVMFIWWVVGLFINHDLYK